MIESDCDKLSDSEQGGNEESSVVPFNGIIIEEMDKSNKSSFGKSITHASSQPGAVVRNQ